MSETGLAWFEKILAMDKYGHLLKGAKDTEVGELKPKPRREEAE